MDTLREQWQQSSIRQWFTTLSPREGRLVQAVVLAAIVAVAYVGLVQPLLTYRDVEVARWRAEANGVAWMRANRAQVATLDLATGDESARLSTINDVASSLGIPLRSIRPEASGGFSVRIEGQEFNAVIAWVAAMNEKHGLKVANAQIDFHSAGRVDAQFTVI